jgi:XTP/dITP diphosphohydrolase
MISLVFATNNIHKLTEVRVAAGNKNKILSLSEIGCLENIPETADTLEGNASQKSWYIFNKYHIDCFADDTGLEIDALDGKPGVYSARYAGNGHDHDKNIDKVLLELKNETHRKARFRTVISLIINGTETLFEGIVEGTILSQRKGSKGFGYDPIFVPNGFDKTFAEMELDEKNKISHRGLAVKKLTEFLVAYSEAV